MLRQARGPVSTLSERVAKILEDLAAQKLAIDAATNAMIAQAEAAGKVKDSIAGAVGHLKKTEEEFKKVSEEIAGTFVDSFQRGFDGIGDAFKKLMVRMAADAAKSGLARILGGLFGRIFGGPVGAAAGSAVGGAVSRAHGGPLSRGQAALVGERGPELFIPNTAGRIVPRGGGSVVNNVTVIHNNTFNNVHPAAMPQMVQLLQMTKQQTMTEIQDLMRRGRF